MLKRNVNFVYLSPPSTAGKRRRGFQMDDSVIESAKLLELLGVETVVTSDGLIVTPEDMRKFAAVLQELVILKEATGDIMSQ